MPEGSYRVQSPGFPKIVYYGRVSLSGTRKDDVNQCLEFDVLSVCVGWHECSVHARSVVLLLLTLLVFFVI